MIAVETHPTLVDAERAMGADARFLGGGTIVMRAVNEGDISFRRIVRARDASLGAIRTEGRRLVLGAGVTMAAVAASPDCAALAPVARQVAGPQIRTMATVGGNLHAAAPYGDFAAALLALDATVRFADGSEQAVEAFLAERDRSRRLVAAVALDRPERDAFRFAKLSRVRPKGVSVMSLAARLPRAGGRLSGVRLAWGAMGPTPLRAKAAERALEGRALDAAGIAEALRVAAEGLAPADDALASAWYRREVAPVFLRRLLLDEGRA